MSAKERYIVRESTGYRIHPGRNRQNQGGHEQPRTEVLVLDAAYCYRVVWSSWTSVMQMEHRQPRYGKQGQRIGDGVKRYPATAYKWPREKARTYADELAAQLNAEDVEVGAVH